MDIERVTGLSREQFINGYMAPAHPVVISDAMVGWELARSWTPVYLREEYGSSTVQVYNSYFDLCDVMPLARYLDNYFGRLQPAGEVPYVRWYTKLKDLEFYWADQDFERFKNQWSLPAFMPESEYLFPFCFPPDTISPNLHHFPARGIFISARGARTGLHIDPWASDAVLLQLFGEKEWTLYAPSETEYLSNGRECVDISTPDLIRFPQFRRARPMFRFRLKPGESIYVPRGWPHHVETVSDSISLTWNFVHRVAHKEFLAYLATELSDDDVNVLRFFFAAHLPARTKRTDLGSILRAKVRAALTI